MSCVSFTYHVVCLYNRWVEMRALFWSLHGDAMPTALEEKVLAVLGTRPGQTTYAVALACAASLDRDAKIFWASE